MACSPRCTLSSIVRTTYKHSPLGGGCDGARRSKPTTLYDSASRLATRKPIRTLVPVLSIVPLGSLTFGSFLALGSLRRCPCLFLSLVGHDTFWGKNGWFMR